MEEEPVESGGVTQYPRRRVRNAIVFGCASWAVAIALFIPWGRALRGPLDRFVLRAGLRLTFDSFELGWGAVTLHGVRFSLADTSGIDGTARSVHVTWKPRRIDATDVRVGFVGAPLDDVLELARWAQQHRAALSVPIFANNGGARSTRTLDSDRQVTVTASGSAFVLTQEPNSPVIASGSFGSNGVEVLVGDPASPSFRMEVPRTSRSVVLTVAPTPLPEFARAIGADATSEKILISGRATLEPPVSLEAPISARVEGRVEGWTLRPPLELEGLSFGHVATFRTEVEATRVASQLTLRNGRVDVGDSHFHVEGTLGKQPRDSRPSGNGLRVLGAISCRVIADAAATAPAGSGLITVLNGSHAERRTSGWIPVFTGFSGDGALDALRPGGWLVGSNCGIVPLALLRGEAREILEARLGRPPNNWMSVFGRDYPGFTFSDNVGPGPKVPPAELTPNPVTAEISPAERRGYVGELVSFDVVVHANPAMVRGAWTAACAGPARFASSAVAVPGEEHRHLEALVEPWRPAPDGGLRIAQPYSGTHFPPVLQHTLPIVPLDYEELAPVWVDRGREEALPELSVSQRDDEMVVRYQPRITDARFSKVRAILIRSNGTNLLYVGATIVAVSEGGYPKEAGAETWALAFPASVSRPVRVLVSEHHEDACEFRTVELTVR